MTFRYIIDRKMEILDKMTEDVIEKIKQENRDADDGNVVTVPAGEPVYPVGFIWWRYGFGVL